MRQLLDPSTALLVAHAARDCDHAQIREGLRSALRGPSTIIGRGDVAAQTMG
jgi:hypothetical protein